MNSRTSYNNGPNMAAHVVHSYGVYDINLHCNSSIDEDGFIPRRANVYPGVLVNASGDSTVVRNSQQSSPGTTANHDSKCGWCLSTDSTSSPSPERTSCTGTWCRPTILLLILVLLVVVFVLVSGILLYSNYLMHKPRNDPIEGTDNYYEMIHAVEPCEKTFCAWGAHCINSPDGRALCQCPTLCKQKAEPVCGTDGKTYSSHCELRVESCKARLNTRIKYVGECGQNDPCQSKLCGFGARCVVPSDGENATCLCPNDCTNSYGMDGISQPVCGSDGVNYKSECEMNRTACISNKNITVMFKGKCDPCSELECSEPELCQLDEERNPVCRCGDACPLEFNPVCGSDGKTYSNECLMRQEACRTRKSLNIIYRGKCSSGINPCMSIQCNTWEECAINKFGIAQCQCPSKCEPIMRPVCSKDGRTFTSECEMKRTSCLGKTTIEIAYNGICGEKGACSGHECQYGAICVEKFGTAFCECPLCPAEFEPVCGSDGISYGNECKLRLEACKHRRDITVLYNGACRGCENKKCEFYSVCESDGSSEAQCVCPQSCTDPKLNNGTVCGTDGVTYASECELRMMSCKTKLYVITAYKGNCDLCEGVECKNDAHCEAGKCVCPKKCEGAGDEPVCASNRMTYPNECELQKAVCLQPSNEKPLNVLFYGDCREHFPLVGPLNTSPNPLTMLTYSATGAETVTSPHEKTFHDNSSIDEEKEACRDIICDFEATCELGADKYPRCTCQFDCESASSTAKPVCASDFKIYPSICAMKMEACQRQEELRLRPLDLCQGMEVKPCKGEKPLTDTSSGRELDCGNGPFRQDCPAGSYCHQTARFAKCCKKDQNFVEKKSCEDGWYGCCPDGKNPALGPNFAGCPSLCGCNKLGSYSDVCDPDTLKCKCRPGVGGLKCDRCESGFWGLPKISSGYRGCIPCGCSVFGSVRDDCEQMTGRCVCKPGVQGQKCTVCTSHNKVLGPNGCVTADLTTSPPTSCKELTCYFGAACHERNGYAVCECHMQCSEDTEKQVICGSDGQNYNSQCELRQLACKLQRDIVFQAFGTCKENMFPSTDWPLRRYTPIQFTQPDLSISPLSKSTRHLLVQDPRYYYERGNNIRQVSYSAELDYKDQDFNYSGPALNVMYHTKGGDFAPVYRPTPATVRVVTALLGDICSDNSDCLIFFSHCVNGACTCIPNYTESPNKQECLANLDPKTKYLACSSAPCHHASTCVDLPLASFSCVCNSNFTGVLCETEIQRAGYEVPAFNGRSYVKLKPLKAYHKLTLEVEFKSYKDDGLLLYNQQKVDGTGDFVSLAIVNGFVEFKYNLGNGAVSIRSLDKIQLGKFHRIILKRFHRDGILKFDEGEEVAGQAKGSLKALDLLEDAFIGYVPTNFTRVFENIGTDKGFEGCIRKLKIGRQEVELHMSQQDWVLKTKDIRDCNDHVCSQSPCQNDGKCLPLDDSFQCDCPSPYVGDFCEKLENPCVSNPCQHGSQCIARGKTFVCECPPGRSGNRCEMEFKDVQILTPEFNGSSLIKFTRLEGVKKKFFIEVTFIPKSSNGLILYNGQMKNGKGDFISLNLVKGYVQFRFNLGSGIANITSKDPIPIGHWHRVRITRDGREGTLQIDNTTTVRGYSGVPLIDLNLETPLFIGALSNWKQIHRLSGATKGFKGAIQKLSVNGNPLPISTFLPNCDTFSAHNSSGCGVNLAYYDGFPCYSSQNPCRNGGICIPELGDFTCKCKSQYRGRFCEIVHENTFSLKLDGNTMLQYKNRGYRSDNLTYDIMDEVETGFNKTDEDDNNEIYDENNYEFEMEDLEILRKAERGNRYEIKIRTFSSDGLLLWRSKYRELPTQYFAIAVNNGYPELSYNMESETPFFRIRSNIRVDDGNWHTIHARRRKRIGYISVDDHPPTRGILRNGGTALRTSAKLWIGGAPLLPPGFPNFYYKGFIGCIQQIVVNAKPIDLLAKNDINKIQFCHENEI